MSPPDRMIRLLRGLLRSLLRILAAVAAILAGIGFVLAQPSCRRNPPSAFTVDPARLRTHVDALAIEFHPRNWHHPDNLERCADYIARHFAEAGAAIEFQTFQVAGQTYRNVIGRFGGRPDGRLIVGAHYDACGDTPGADDNASGVAVLIELAGLLGRQPPAPTVELVAYTLEEPPFFATEHMGSAVHAARLAAEPTGLRGVIVLEMVGFFSDRRGSQSYPLPLLHLLYPSRGNFIGVVGRWDQGPWIKTVKAGMQDRTPLPVYSIRAPQAVPGIDLSDHRNYWPHGIPAVMVTDTAFFRNPAYHTAGDTPERLDYVRMAQVAVAVFEALRAP
jgi:hypothetical protein